MFNAISHTRWAIIAHNPSCSPFSFALCNLVRESELAPCEKKPVRLQTQSGTSPRGGRRRGRRGRICYSLLHISSDSPSSGLCYCCLCQAKAGGRAESRSVKLVNHFLFSLRTAVDWRERPLCPPSPPASQQMCRFTPSGACLQRGRKTRRRKNDLNPSNASAFPLAL